MDSARLYYHSPIRTGQESKIYLWKESNLHADPVSGGPSRGRVPSRLTWRTQGLLACHLTILSNWVLTGLYHYEWSLQNWQNDTFEIMESVYEGNIFPHLSIGPCIPHISHYTMLAAEEKPEASSKQLNQPLFFIFLLLNQSLKQSLRMKVKCSYILKQRFTR